MKILKWLDLGLKRTEEAVLSLAIITITVMVAGNTISRNLGLGGWAFAEEISQIAIYMATFLGLGYVARQGRHISMTALFDNVPYKFRKTLALIIPFVTAFVLFTLAYYSYDYVLSSQNRVTDYLRISYVWMVVWAPIGFLLGGIQFLRNFWVNVKNKDVYIAAERKDYDTEQDAKESNQL
ncbi:TRAP-type C4-dicarboxylate transport system, small permease component [Marinococcus luteus]|uniref:TRAP-type C4-dicarboxylate transport system, small permease component n=1 Tax=Marinococcus luteus TaxID=1122204 RepID=A0A1H2XLC2_9BACI|nr:TRAP transporter small permease [Marinococcus luteus]SDW93693.1 TRAP-type C4-dicarboxylate transport system, small permease component [Marinococcus luteus]